MIDGDLPDNTHRLWYLLLGAMLAHKPTRDLAMERLSVEDLPARDKPLVDLWQAVTNGDKAGVSAVARAWNVEIWNDGVVASIVRRLQEVSAQEMCNRSLSSVQFAKGLTPEQLLTLLDTTASRIRARQAQIEQGKQGKKREGDCKE